MNTARVLFLSTLFALACSTAGAYTLTFDDGPAADRLQEYANRYGILFDASFYVSDHSGSAWGRPYSGSYVLASEPYSSTSFWAKGRSETGYRQPSSISAYFSTQMDAVVRLDYSASYFGDVIGSVYIGAPGQSWSNQFVEIRNPGGTVNTVDFYPVSSYDALSRFCLDDMTVTLVPEPASLLPLLLGLLPLAAATRRSVRRA